MAEVRRGAKINPDGLELNERVVQVNRVAKVVKGGRRFSFSALVVVGNEVNTVGVGHGKAKEVPVAIQKAVEDAKKNLFRVPKYRTTITHQVLGRSGAGKVFMKPASEGTGVIAGGGVRAVLELAGIRDILTKSLGTSQPGQPRGGHRGRPQGPAPARGGRGPARQDRRRGARHLVRLRRPGHRGRRRDRGGRRVSRLAITQIQSEIGTQQRHRGTLRALGLRRIGQTVQHDDSPVIQGMLRMVAWLVRVEKIDG